MPKIRPGEIMIPCSVLIATYNMRQYIIAAVASALQNMDCSEVVVVDDGSTDGTLDALATAFPAVRRLIVKRFDANRGKVAAYNYAFESSSGATITLLGADDILLPGRASLVASLLRTNESVIAVGDYTITDSELHPIVKRSAVLVRWPEILAANSYPGGTMVISRSIASQIFPIDPSIKNEDYIISLIACRSGIVKVVNKNVLLYRQHQSNTWGSANAATRVRLNAARDVEILHYFVDRCGPFSANERASIRVALSVRHQIVDTSMGGFLRLLPQMITRRYPAKVILKAFPPTYIALAVRDATRRRHSKSVN